MVVQMKIIKGEKVTYLTFPNWQWPWLRHGFSTRLGGCSKGFLAQLNMKEHPQESKETLDYNREIFANEFELGENNLIYGQQIHSNEITCLEGFVSSPLEGQDGLVTREKNLALMAYFADCLALFFVVPKVKAVGIVHAGWRGSLLAIGPKAIDEMQRVWQIEAREIFVGLGPSIGQCCYEVNEEVRAKFLASNEEYKLAFSYVREGHYLLDLKLINTLQLLAQGIPQDNISSNSLCTSCDQHLFYSHRRDKGATGRMAALIAVV